MDPEFNLRLRLSSSLLHMRSRINNIYNTYEIPESKCSHVFLNRISVKKKFLEVTAFIIKLSSFVGLNNPYVIVL